MQFVLTLIASQCKLDKLIIEQVQASIAANTQINWLLEDFVCDVFFDNNELEKINNLVKNIIQDLPIDFVIQTANNRKKRMLISDMDSTMITVECIDEIAGFAGVKTQVSEITERAMRGELDFIQALNERVALLKGLPAQILEEVYSQRVKFMNGAETLVKTMQKNGARTILVSGGFDFFTKKVANELGFEEEYANILEVTEGKLSGKVIPPILDKYSKLVTLNDRCKYYNLQPTDVIAVGDGANDLPMLMAAGMGVAYHAKPVVQEHAKACINHNDLTALLYIQGYVIRN
jgi:phosphoserine phosphatase